MKIKMRKLKPSIMSNIFAKRGKSKYSPHQGKQENARRRKQIEKGMIK